MAEPGFSSPQAEALGHSAVIERRPAQAIGRRQYLFAWCVAAIIIIGGAVATPFASMPLVAIPNFMTMFCTAMILVNLALAGLLFGRGTVEGSDDCIRLGAAYLFAAAVFVPLFASFPDGLMQGSLIGRSESVAWLWCFWHVGFCVAILRCAVLARRSPPRRASVTLSIVVVLAAVTAGGVGFTAGVDELPAILLDGRLLLFEKERVLPLVVILAALAALVGVVRLGARTPSQLWLTIGMLATCFDVWLTLHGEARYALGWYLAKAGSLLASLAVLQSLFQDVMRLYGEAAANNSRLIGLARTDALTGLANRRWFDEMLEVEWRRGRRDRQPVSLLMVDVDHFKAFNDRYGHPHGDACLRRLAATLRLAARRPADLVARYGGEEFVVLLPATSPEDAMLVAERLRESIVALALPHESVPRGIVTVSIGVATDLPNPNGDPMLLLSAADARLYIAKQSGRDRVSGPLVERPTDTDISLASLLEAAREGPHGWPRPPR